MPAFSFRIKFDDAKARRLISSKQFQAKLNKHVSRQFLPLGRSMTTRVQRLMKSNSFAAQGIVQTVVKGHNRVLIHTNVLHNSIKFRYVKDGYLRGIEIYILDGTYGKISTRKVALIQHKGTSWMPSIQQRRAIMFKLRNAGVGSLDQTSSVPTQWTIPSRPFFMQALSGPDVRVLFGHYVTRALQGALREMGWGGSIGGAGG